MANLEGNCGVKRFERSDHPPLPVRTDQGRARAPDARRGGGDV